jgi:hypothetical protein
LQIYFAANARYSSRFDANEARFHAMAKTPESIQAKMDAMAVEYVCALWKREELSFARPLVKILLPETKKRGRKPETNYFRDRDVVAAIFELWKLGWYTPTRNRSLRAKEKGQCGCSIVVKALAKRGQYLSEDAVVKIWERCKTGEFEKLDSYIVVRN